MEIYFRVTLYIPFLDTIIEQLNLRFTKKTKAASLFKVLCASSCMISPTQPSETDFLALWNTYSAVLHANNIESGDIMGIKALSEFKQWMTKWKRVNPDQQPDTLLASLRQCDKNIFPIIHALLTIAVVIPISTATPERTFSTLKLLKSYLRNRCTENRLNGLAHMYMHSTEEIDVENIIDRFASVKQRRINL